MDFDVIVIGGGAAGLSGAVTLARSRRRVLVLDSGEPRNAPAEGVHGFLGHGGIPPLELLERGRAELAGYGGEYRSSTVRELHRISGGFDVDGTTARRLLVATGLVDELPDVPGLREQWGRGVVHCPYCHGWEVRDKRIAVLATTPLSTHQALLFSQLSATVTFLLHEQDELPAENARKLTARGVDVITGRVERIVSDGKAITGVQVGEGVVPCEVVVIGAAVSARGAVLEQLGIEPVDFELAGVTLGTYVPADPTGRTAVNGVWVAGNVANPQAQVVHAAGAGVLAAATINMDLIEEDVRSAG